VAGEGAATGAELYVGHGTVWVNGDNGYIAMQVSGLEVLPGAGLTDSGITPTAKPRCYAHELFWIRDADISAKICTFTSNLMDID
ncbi:hypothetical protein CWI66_17535, partial [Halomonas sp. 141]|uniref:hypothetical protein n=1 Tax=Halomonas sp. 141 TaxID=2056666 RepID=UPI000CAF7748